MLHDFFNLFGFTVTVVSQHIRGQLIAKLNGDRLVFDSEGNLRHKQQAEEVIETGLQLIEELNNEGTRKAAQKVMRTLPDLFHFQSNNNPCTPNPFPAQWVCDNQWTVLL